MLKKLAFGLALAVALLSAGLFLSPEVGRAADDITPPRLVSTTPANGAQVTRFTSIVMTYNENIQPGSAFTSISVKNASGQPVWARRSISGNKLTLTPLDNAWDNGSGSLYTASIPKGALKDSSGNSTTVASSLTFSTKDLLPPTLASVLPANGATGVAATTALTLYFKENIVLVDKSLISVVCSDPSKASYSYLSRQAVGNKLYVRPGTGKWDAGIGLTYTVTIKANAIADAAGNKYNKTLVYRFTTKDLTAPTRVSSAPAYNASNLPLTLRAFVKYSETIKAGVNYEKITATRDGKAVSLSKTIFGSELRLKPTEGWKNTSSYTIVIPAGAVADKAGNLNKAAITLQFKTIPPKVNVTITKMSPTGKALRGTAIKIYYTVSATSNLKLEILDSSDRLRRVLTKKNVSGTGYFTWDGYADGQGNMPYGMCTFRLTATPLDLTKNIANDSIMDILLKAHAKIALTKTTNTWHYDSDYYLSTYFALNGSGAVSCKIMMGDKTVISRVLTFTSNYGEGQNYDCLIRYDGYDSNGKPLKEGSYKFFLTYDNGVSTSTVSYTFKVVYD